MTIRDGDWELVNYDQITGRSVWHWFDGEKLHQRTDYPVDQIVKDNTTARNELAGRNWGEGQRVASIPLNIFFDQLNDAQAQGDNKFISKWLNDGDNAAFRTFEGRV
jgi:hypothetical protein